MSIEPGTLYVVATPIGNLDDMTPRALDVLRIAARIAAEDTRRTGSLLRHFGIDTPLQALHEHNERQVVPDLVRRLQSGESIALVSDAGTPLVSDPGYHLTRAAHAAGLRVSPIPGASAVMAALSAAGLASDRFLFVGFLPAKAGQRHNALKALQQERATLIFFEAPHRIAESLQAMADVFGADRTAALGRELTKTFETVRQLPLGELATFVANDPDQQRGEAVILVEGAPAAEEDGLDADAQRIALLLADELPVKQAAALTARITGAKKNAVYQWLLESRG